MEHSLKSIKHTLGELTYIGSTLGLLSWDQQVNLPQKSAHYRGEQLSYLSGLLHKKLTATSFVNKVDACIHPRIFKTLSIDDQVIIRELHREITKLCKIPVQFATQQTRTYSEAFSVWLRAREASNFSLFEPVLERVVALKQKEARLYGFTDSPYDPLLDNFEPGLSARDATQLFNDCVPFLKTLITRVAHTQKNIPHLSLTFPIKQQEKLCKEIITLMGYDVQAGHIATSAHPFSTYISPYDSRITLRYDEHNLWEALGSAIHETGHALYNQGLPSEHYGMALGEALSFGIHESQSRIWENMIGKSYEFISHIHPLIKKYFPRFPFTAREYYQYLIQVTPTLIRTESDEVTYNIHIIIRFELEKALVEGTLAVAQLRDAWNAKYKEYLGIDVPRDADGVLQDVHWASGYFGYFPSYTLGNVYAAQMFAAAQKQIPTLSRSIRTGDLKPFLSWLRTNVHIHGKRYTSAELIKQISGEPLSTGFFKNYLKNKYS